MQLSTMLYVPPSLHEAEIERHFADPQKPGDEPRSLTTAMAAARRSAEQLLQAMKQVEANRTLSPEGDAEELRKITRASAEKAGGALDTARQHASDVLKRLEAGARTAPLPPAHLVAIQIEAEVRSRLASMSPGDRRKALAAALENGDDTMVGAVLRGPTMLTGTDPAEQDLLRQAWHQARHPEKAARIDRLGWPLETADRGSTLLARFTDQVFAAPSGVQVASGWSSRRQSGPRKALLPPPRLSPGGTSLRLLLRLRIGATKS